MLERLVKLFYFLLPFDSRLNVAPKGFCPLVRHIHYRFLRRHLNYLIKVV